MNNFLKKPLAFDWVEASLEAYVRLEERKARVYQIKSMAREIVAICRASRDRVEKAEAFLEKYREVIPSEEKQNIFRLMAETLLYIQYEGVRMRISDNPRTILNC